MFEDSIMILIIGTVHETDNETRLFDILNKKTKDDNNIKWLCEGENDKRRCTSLKNNDIHLVTDALFVNMLLLNGITDYDRIIELFITISRCNNDEIFNSISKRYIQYIKKLPPANIEQDLLKDIERDLKTIAPI